LQNVRNRKSVKAHKMNVIVARAIYFAKWKLCRFLVESSNPKPTQQHKLLIILQDGLITQALAFISASVVGLDD